MTAGGYSYEVVSDASAPAEKAPAEPRPARRTGLWPVAVVLAVIGGALVGAVAAWFIAGWLGGESSDDERVNANVANIINAFTQGQGQSTIERFEGELPPGFPDDIPTYPDSEVVSSIVQLGADDALFLIAYDTPDSREDVAAYFRDELDSGNFQIDGAQDGREADLIQFSKTDDADVSGLVLVAESKDREITTVFYSVEVIAGADDVDLAPFVPRVSRPLPADFPTDVPTYPDAIVVETVTQRESGADLFGIAFITRDTSSSVLDFYRERFEEAGWTVTDADTSQSDLEDAQGINFESEDGELSGSVTTGVFRDDRNYTRVELQVQATR
jgi:hypothetical protein